MGGKSTPEQRRAYYVRNRERIIQERRQFRALNAGRLREQDRLRYRPDQMRAWRLTAKHGMQPEDWATIWAAQGGRCYLCGDLLVDGKTAIDHDHSHCDAEQTCRICRRGLACKNCNASIGLAGDDPARLRRMADALEAAQSEVNKRKASGAGIHEQMSLLEELA